MDRALGLLAEDLREKYFEYLKAPDDDDDGELAVKQLSLPHTECHLFLHSALSHRSSQLEQELRENISQLKTTIEM